ncbi:MAG: L-seryl-tRNA(Sec) selenium transferase [Polyangia bacterium]
MPADAFVLRDLPKVGDVLESELGRSLLAAAPRWAVVDAVRAEIDARRTARDPSPLDALVLRAAVDSRLAPSLRRVVNATGVVLHTNLGRAPLAESAVERVADVARGYSNLELTLDDKKRGSRHDHVVDSLRALTFAEDALVVNNCAAAVLLALTGLAKGGDVVVSRGELVEIGGGFRVPEVMAASGARLVEVGTTNRTRVSDYELASARLLMKVHRSNFAIVGFTEEASVAALAPLAKRLGVPLFVDLGSGSLSAIAGLPGDPEPTVPSLIAAGADLVAFSGDKLLGGPQAGILVGRRELIASLSRHPLLRALRPDKLTIAALEATLALHRDGRSHEIPTVAMLSVPEPTLESRARALSARLLMVRPEGHFTACRVRSAVGGGSMPTVEPWSWAVSASLPGVSEAALDEHLRRARPPVLGRLAHGDLLLDVRTLLADDATTIERAFAPVRTPERTGG